MAFVLYSIYGSNPEEACLNLFKGINKIKISQILRLFPCKKTLLDQSKSSEVALEIEAFSQEYTGIKNCCSMPISIYFDSYLLPQKILPGLRFDCGGINNASLKINLFGVKYKIQAKLLLSPPKPAKPLETKRKKLRKNDQSENQLRFVKEIEIEEGTTLCSICMAVLPPERGVLTCGHMFCSQCISDWAKQATLCPICKKNFRTIINEELGREVSRITLPYKRLKVESDVSYEPEQSFQCYECHSASDEACLLVCEECEMRYCHTYCEGLSQVPKESWCCKYCREELENLLLLQDF